MSTEPWPLCVTQRLSHIDRDDDKTLLNGPYNTILATVFSAADGYVVTPRVFFPDSNKIGIDPPIEFIVELGLDAAPAMAMTVRRGFHYETPHLRWEADLQVRDLCRSLSWRLKASTLQVAQFHVVSVIGTRCGIFTLETATGRIVPERIRPTDLSVEQDLPPVSRWGIDLNTLEGRCALNRHFEAVKTSHRDIPVPIQASPSRC